MTTAGHQLNPLDVWGGTPADELQTEDDVSKDVHFATLRKLHAKDQQAKINHIIQHWPWRLDRYLIQWSDFAMVAAPSGTAAFIGYYLGSKRYFGPGVNYGRFHAWSASVFALGPVFVLSYVGNRLLRDQLFSPYDSCTPCVTVKRILMTCGTGVVLPFMTMPWYCLSMAQIYGMYRVPKATDIREVMQLQWRNCGPVVQRYFLPFCLLHLASSSISTYCQEYGRNRILFSLDDDPELGFRLLSVPARYPFVETYGKVMDWFRQRFKNKGDVITTLEKGLETSSLEKRS